MDSVVLATEQLSQSRSVLFSWCSYILVVLCLFVVVVVFVVVFHSARSLLCGFYGFNEIIFQVNNSHLDHTDQIQARPDRHSLGVFRMSWPCLLS